MDIDKNRVKIKQSEFLPLLLDGFSDGLTLTQMAQRLGKSKQALNYHIQRLKRIGVLERKQSWPYAIYGLTPFGSRLKQNLRYPQTPKTWRYHALQVGFDIVDFGSFNLIETKNRKLSKMNNWLYVTEQQGDYHVKIQENGLLVISCPERYTNEPDSAAAELHSKAIELAQQYCDRYSMKMKPMKIIRRGQKSIVGSEKISKILGKGKLSEDIWVDASHGTDELETFSDNKSLEKLLAVPDEIAQVKQDMNDLKAVFIPAIEALTEQIRLHLKATEEWRQSAQEIRDALKDITELKRGKSNG